MYSISRNGTGIEFVPSLSILTEELTIYNFNSKFKNTLSESISFTNRRGAEDALALFFKWVRFA